MKIKRPAKSQQPEVYLEPKWLRCPPLLMDSRSLGAQGFNRSTSPAAMGFRGRGGEESLLSTFLLAGGLWGAKLVA